MLDGRGLVVNFWFSGGDLTWEPQGSEKESQRGITVSAAKRTDLSKKLLKARQDTSPGSEALYQSPPRIRLS